MNAVLAIDQGTTGTTALVVATDGRVVGRGYREITQHFPAPGEVEHDPAEILERSVAAAREALAQTSLQPAAIGITNQRETVCVWDRATGEPLARAIVWQDRRTGGRCRQLAERHRAADIAARTGLVLDPYFSATKIEWLLANVPGLAERAKRGSVAFGTIDSWLVFRLTKGRAHVTDHTNASRTMLYNLDRRAWDDELLGEFGVPRAALPEIRNSSGMFGTCAREYFGADVPILGVAGDQQAALYGQACFDAGGAKNTYGTGAFLLLNTGSVRGKAEHGLLCTIACGPRGEPVYALEGSVFIAGAAIQWLRDGLHILDTAAESETLARSVDDSGGVVLVPAFVGLGAPYWRPDVRGAILGLTRGTTRAHLARAALESLAFQTRDVFDAMARDAGKRVTILRVDGGAATNDLLMQYQADVLGVAVERPKVVETTALGAGLLAGLAVGLWRSPRELTRVRAVDRVFKPRQSRAWREAEVARWTRAVKTLLRGDV